jgi:hypothetical protein
MTEQPNPVPQPDTRPQSTAAPEQPLPAVGDKYTCITEAGTRTVTVTRVWATEDANGGTAVAFEWADDKHGQCRNALSLGVFLGTYKPAVDDDAAREEQQDRELTQRAHNTGDHQWCDVTCEAEFPSEVLRNTILCRAIPGSPSMLAELERRATATGQARPTQPPANDGTLQQRTEAAIRALNPEGGTLADLDEANDVAVLADAVLPLVAGARAAAYRAAADFVRDAHFRDGLTVQEIGSALRNTADQMGQQ